MVIMTGEMVIIPREVMVAKFGITNLIGTVNNISARLIHMDRNLGE